MVGGSGGQAGAATFLRKSLHSVLLQTPSRPFPPGASLRCAVAITQFGEEAVKEGMGGGGGGGGGPADIFDLFGMGGGGRRGSQRERRSEDVVHK